MCGVFVCGVMCVSSPACQGPRTGRAGEGGAAGPGPADRGTTGRDGQDTTRHRQHTGQGTQEEVADVS